MSDIWRKEWGEDPVQFEDYSERFTKHELADWISDNTGLPWLKLDFKIPWESFLEDVQKIQKDEWINYRDIYSNNKWHAVVLHGFENKPMTASDYGIGDDVPREWTTLGHKCKNIKSFIDNECKFKFQERTRIMRLDPGGEIFLHHDRLDQSGPLTKEISRLSTLHFVITNPEGMIFDIPHWGNIPLNNGDVFLFDNKWEHQLKNNSNEPRYHIIFNGADLSDMFWVDIKIRSWEKYKKQLIY